MTQMRVFNQLFENYLVTLRKIKQDIHRSQVTFKTEDDFWKSMGRSRYSLNNADVSFVELVGSDLKNESFAGLKRKL